MYQVQRASHSDHITIRHLRYHVRHWGDRPVAGAAPATTLPPLVLVHGWMDVAASYQFMVDALSPAFMQGRWIMAPDWRGFGDSDAGVGGHTVDNYWMADYLADLDALLDHYAPGQTVDLVGHSMGGNIAMLYAGVRPQRIRRLINLEGFGMPATRPAQAPSRYAKWLDELKTLHRGEMDLKAYADAEGVARRLTKTNPRLTPDKAAWLARQWARPGADGQWQILGHPAHKIINAHLYQVDEALAIYRCISAPTLAIEASDDSLGRWWQGKYTLAEYHERLRSVPELQKAVVQDAGHMLHHDQPLALAQLIEGFLA